ncbi:HD domain-containing phosphohydrolase [Shewanella woodyi]|uniref:HD domain-containing phosphohydrolase n=1 Tax=Shewanella woodyi TaxID=60961 RepID=UPI0007EB61FB|nr:HD domain-containing phosphohydrolase [Shewanella woodyi]
MFFAEGNERRRITIRFTVVSIFILATVLTSAIAISLQYYFSQSMATESALKHFDRDAKHMSKYLSQLDTEAANITKLLSGLDQLVEDDHFNRKALYTFAELMRSNPIYFGVNVGLPNGDFYQLINLDAFPSSRVKSFSIPSDRWLFSFVTGTGDNRIRQFKYLNDDLQERISRDEVTVYDPRVRPWFVNAQFGNVSRTQPYLFDSIQSPGKTYSIKLPDHSGAVLGMDITLDTFSKYLSTVGQNISGGSANKVYVYKPSGDIIASNQEKSDQLKIPESTRLELPPNLRDFVDNLSVLRVSNQTNWPPIDFAISGQPYGYVVDLMKLISQMTGLDFSYVNGLNWKGLVDAYKTGKIEVLQSIIMKDENRHLGVFSEPFLSLSYSVVTLEKVQPITNILELKGHKVAVPVDWLFIEQIKQHFPDIEFVEYASTHECFQAVIREEALATLDTGINLRYTARQFFIEELRFHDSLSFSPYIVPTELRILAKNKRLIETINLALANITPEQKDALKLKWIDSSSLGLPMKTMGVVPYKALIDIGSDSKKHNKLHKLMLNGIEHFVYVTEFASGHSMLGIVVPSNIILAPSRHKVLTSIFITAVCMLTFLPVAWIFSNPIIKPINLLCRENVKIKHRDYDSVIKVGTCIKELDELSDSMLEMAEAHKEYEESQKELIEAIIRLIAQAVDDKSPYTAGHCNRVPELGLMLADAAHKAQSGPFATFSFKNEDEHREFRIAAWLHDCGKITTPEHIVDKGTKLEANYNRIHEIRMRFEVLWRDAEIVYLTLLAQSPANEAVLREQLNEKHEQFRQDFEFIANANIGGEFMSQEDKDRLGLLANVTWERHFDDRLGLSPFEELRFNEAKTEASYPVIEKLLGDKPEHIFKRLNKVEFDPKFGIKMEIPEHQYNLGELYNLSVSRGTLTAEDRYKINEHIISTIKMLDSLPFPPELARVPRYASTHHETLIGTGYPRKLTGEELSIPERVLVIADIFEALTAADRPYKKAKPVSVAVDILHKMALDEHLDIELFKLFLSSGIYLEYANKFLDPSQIDEVDISRYLD